MKNKVTFLLTCAFILNATLFAQEDIHQRGVLQFEVKVNNHKNTWWADDEDMEEDGWKKQYLENTPKFSTYYYSLKFGENKSLFTYTGRDEKIKKMWEDDKKEDDIWFNDFTAQKYSYQKSIFGDAMKIEDSIKKINWKLVPNDTREFAGFNCKKAVGIIYDSVYVFAYYTDAIAISAGPMRFNGLPGAILGLTVPRMSLSCIATSFSPLVNVADIVPPKRGKPKPTTEIVKKIAEATKDWGRWAHKGIWQSFL